MLFICTLKYVSRDEREVPKRGRTKSRFHLPPLGHPETSEGNHTSLPHCSLQNKIKQYVKRKHFLNHICIVTLQKDNLVYFGEIEIGIEPVTRYFVISIASLF